jgi:hypothetical protein
MSVRTVRVSGTFLLSTIAEINRKPMPTIGELLPQRCVECSGLMYWVPDAVLGEADGREYPAYRCANAHVSDACTACGSRNTTRYGSGPLTSRRTVSLRHGVHRGPLRPAGLLVCCGAARTGLGPERASVPATLAGALFKTGHPVSTIDGP